MMTSPKRSLHPACGDDGGALLSALELVASSAVQGVEIGGAVVGKGMPLEPSPKELYRIEVGSVGRQKGDLDMSTQAIEVIAYQAAAMRFQSIPDDEQGALELSL